jgi:hypothetical protein
MGTLESMYKIGDEIIEIWRYGVNDYAVNYVNGDCSVRGTLIDVWTEIFSIYAEDIFEQEVVRV